MRSGKILVVGATGKVGGAAVERLLEAGFEVRALVRRPEKGARLRSLGAETVVGDATTSETLRPAVEGCAGVFSALGAGPGRGGAQTVEYQGNLNLLSAARSAGVERFVYSSVHLADPPLAQKVGAFREKARFERELLAAEHVSSTVLRPAIFMETLDMMIQGPVAFVPGSQRRPVSFDDAFERLGRGRGKEIRVLHVPLIAMRLPGRFVPYVRELANMMAFFDAVGFAADPSVLRDTFGIPALTIEQWASQGRQPGNDWEETNNYERQGS